MHLEDLHRAVGPAIALLLEVEEGVRHQAATIAARRVAGLVPRLHDRQAELGVLGDAPFGPAAHLVEDVATHQGHRAVLDDRVALVARDHAEPEEAPVLRMRHRLEGAFAGVAVVLRSLHDGDTGIVEGRHEIAEPVVLDQVVAVDHGHDRRVRRGVAQREVERPSLEAFERIHVEEAEARPEAGAAGLDRAPHGRVTRVVVDHDDFEVRVVES